MTQEEKEKNKKQQFLIEFGNHIRKIRKEKGITGSELSRLLFMDKPNITRIEKGRINSSIYMVKQICKALDISLDEFFKDFKYRK